MAPDPLTIRHATLALQWWASYPRHIPFHAVARGLRLSYTDLRALLASCGIDVHHSLDDDERHGTIDAADARRLLAERSGLLLPPLRETQP